jgi:hypothetical protein
VNLEGKYVKTKWDELLQHVYEAERKIKYWKLLCAIHKSSFTEQGITEKHIIIFRYRTLSCWFCSTVIHLSGLFVCSCYFLFKDLGVIPHINPDNKDRAGYETQTMTQLVT